MGIWLKNQPWNDINLSGDDIEREVEWNLWRVRQRPFFELAADDTVFIAVGGHGLKSSVTWETRVSRVVRDRYRSLAHAARIINDNFGTVIDDPGQFHRWTYSEDRPLQGWILAMSCEPVRRLDHPVPRGPELHVAQNGWLDLGDKTPAELRRLGLLISKPGGRAQGRMSNHDLRVVVDRHAMRSARRHLRTSGWSDGEIIDTSASKPYDFECQRAGVPLLRVEVKGTTTSGAKVLLTRGEVDHATLGDVPVALLVLSRIEITKDGKGNLRASGGRVEYIEPWKPEPSRLQAETYSYLVRPPGG